MKERIELLVEGGKATPGPSTAPKLAMAGLNVGEVFAAINKATAEYAGLQVPVTVEVDKRNKSYTVQVGIPPVSSLIKRELRIEKAKYEGKPVGNLSMEQVIRIARLKQKDMLTRDLRAAVKCVLGTAASMGVSVEGKSAKEVLQELEKWKIE